MDKNQSKSLEIAKKYLGKEVEIFIDRPMGSKHPKHSYIYEVNYGYLPGVKAPDREDLDAYYLGADKAVEKGKGVAKAVIHRFDDDDDKLVVVPENVKLTDDEIRSATNFQEQFFKSEIIRASWAPFP